MQKIYKALLFDKHILVKSENAPEMDLQSVFASLYLIKNSYGVRITEGVEHICEEHVSFIGEMLGEDVPLPFYMGFPESVRELSPDKRLFDQLLHYMMTYGLGCFNCESHSVFELVFQRLAFNEKVQEKKFIIVEEKKALSLIEGVVREMLSFSRPLPHRQYLACQSYITEYGYIPEKIASKDTAVRLLEGTRNIDLVKFLSLSDIVRLAEVINTQRYYNQNLKKLCLSNKDRKFLTKCLDRVLAEGRCDIETCCEKKAIWNGLLHHLHYKPKCRLGTEFTDLMRGKTNLSVYSAFEKAMAEGMPVQAAKILAKGKGNGALLRNIDYIVSRCGTTAEVEEIVGMLSAAKPTILIQLLLHYGIDDSANARTFVFSKDYLMKTHTENNAEKARRHSYLTPEKRAILAEKIRELLKSCLSGKLGKVYIEKEMYKCALPISESTSQGGFGVLAKGSRISLEGSKKVRAFTYWERVNDIDLSVIGIDTDGNQSEFSWRTMAYLSSNAVTYSGDITNGYSGGSEYFDVDTDRILAAYPDLKYLVFCDNMYSGGTYAHCICRAGYMLRDKSDSGEIFEPATVESSFTVNADSSFVYLFGIDLEKGDFVWLNAARDSAERVAGCTSLAFLTRYFDVVSVINVGMLYEMLADKVVDTPEEADVVVSDNDVTLKEGAVQIHSYDFEKINAVIES